MNYERIIKQLILSNIRKGKTAELTNAYRINYDSHILEYEYAKHETIEDAMNWFYNSIINLEQKGRAANDAR